MIGRSEQKTTEKIKTIDKEWNIVRSRLGSFKYICGKEKEISHNALQNMKKCEVISFLWEIARWTNKKSAYHTSESVEFFNEVKKAFYVIFIIPFHYSQD